jgi:hypothetical protein
VYWNSVQLAGKTEIGRNGMETLHNNPWQVKSADEDMKEATEWLQKTEQLEKQYREELAAAGDDEQKGSKWSGG